MRRLQDASSTPIYDVSMVWRVADPNARAGAPPWRTILDAIGPEATVHNTKDRDWLESRPWFSAEHCAGSPVHPVSLSSSSPWGRAEMAARVDAVLARALDAFVLDGVGGLGGQAAGRGSGGKDGGGEASSAAAAALAADVTDYAVMHACMTGNPFVDPAACDEAWVTDPRFLVLVCDGEQGTVCGGLGDRMSAFVTFTIAGMMAQRAIVLVYTDPVPLAELFAPNLIAWDAMPCVPDAVGDYAVNPLYLKFGPPYGPAAWWIPDRLVWSSYSRMLFRHTSVDAGLTLDGNPDTPVAYLVSNLWPQDLMHLEASPPHGLEPWLDAHPFDDSSYEAYAVLRPFFDVLFTVHDAVLAHAAAADVVVSAGFNTLLGVHIRLGDDAMLGSAAMAGHVLKTTSAVLDLAAEVESILELDPKTTRWLVLSDTADAFDVAVSLVGRDKLAFPPSRGSLVHFDKSTDAHAAQAAFYAAWTDVFVLARHTRCIVGVASGLTRTAAALAPRPCLFTLDRNDHVFVPPI